ncbi:LOW QUALITY PROTEIN: trophoblast glycoprotein-like [Archocentrus centrarchus]|uniref:LOW QUALITY PROTEIN: trophoblast glycoprotein-like n=1 Tax=Archocentrus centrarchus TaxID=63155 RepID=UPI0011EA0EEA|nr:LOW QUALITY PROTEIN: trophoblast glycoprotein-like [Archocentrus centrarchus]
MLDLMQRVVFCALLGSVCASCPPRCECSEAAHTVKCVSKDLRGIPAEIPGYTRNLFITGNQISRIGPESFRGLENLTSLSLSNNRISEVESHTFLRLRSLRSLDLSNNQLAVIHPEAFTVLSQSLRELNLSRALYNYSSVKDLVTSLRWSSLGTLRGLDLSDNNLIFLPPRMFSHLNSLQRLQLSNNSLVAIQNSTLSDLEQLEELDLTLNALKTLSEEGLQELDSLPRAAVLLGDNPFTCMCGIEPFALWLNRSQDRIRDAESLMCAFPASMKNTSLLAVGSLTLGCYERDVGADLALQTSYVFLGIVLGFIGLIFVLVLYLNRKGIKKRIYDMRDACREVWEGYHYRFEMDSDPRLSQVSTSADV